jgi:GT2 family glycosyltransferase
MARDLAVLMACHNRRELTLASLRSLFGQRHADVDVSVFLVDDGSTDRTAEAVTEEFPKVKIIPGNGRLYWSGGMRLAFDIAIGQEFQFHLWLNDDVVLSNDAIGNLLSTYDKLMAECCTPIIVVGAVRDPVTGSTTYSGLRRGPLWHPLRFGLVEPAEVPIPCDTMHGNVVLIPRDVFQRLGGIDRSFIQTIGDVDYGLRLKKIHGQVWLASEHVGTCARGRDETATSGSMFSRLREVTSIKVLPVRPWLTYVHRHGGPLWPIEWIRPYAKAVLTRRGR